SRSMASKSARSKGASAASPPAARTASSVSSSPPVVRPRRISRAPSAAKRRATAAPMPRDAPVMSAARPATRPLMDLDQLGQQRELRGVGAADDVGEVGRIVAGEAGIAELRRTALAAGLAHRPVEAVDRDEGEAVDADQPAHAVDVELRREQLLALR